MSGYLIRITIVAALFLICTGCIKQQLLVGDSIQAEESVKSLRYGDRPLHEYTIDQALRLPMYGYPEWIETIQQLIRDHPKHPRLGELRYFALIQDAHLKMQSSDDEDPFSPRRFTVTDDPTSQ